MRIYRSAFTLAVLFLAMGLSPVAAQGPASVAPSVVDQVFERFDGTRTPGCAVAVSLAGQPVLSHAYGMADLEHAVANTPETVFEPGSVAKQFTATATILLALDGKLSLDDDVRTYIPELPDYGEPITVRHLLNHTSGLRDWGAVARIEGWPRTSRVHTHVHMLDITSRQRSLNYPPGEYYSYTNTGYNLQAVLVERVSGMSFAEFSRKRILEPLGMTRTQWRDDFTRIVKDRAIAYSPTRDGGYRMNMPFENVHGNGGLLTTVGDLLRFTHNLDTGDLGGPALLEEMHRQGILDSGRKIAYASGLRVGEYKGVREVQHGGSTAGYRGFLTRFPDQGVAVALMCNVGNANPGRLAHAVADLYLGDILVDETAPESDEPTVDVSESSLQALAGGYRNTRSQARLEVTASDGVLRVGQTDFAPVSETRFVAASGDIVEFDASAKNGRPSARLESPNGDMVWLLEPVADFAPSATELAEYTGTYHSDEAEATYTVVVEDGALVFKNRYGEGSSLTPSYPDAFTGSRFGVLIFRRENGRVTALSLVQGRVWDLRFERIF